MSIQTELQQTIEDMIDSTRGILAADESSPTIAKRFKSINVESTEENRRAYRSLILSTPDLGKYICGVILFEETLAQKSDDGVPLPEVCIQQGIVPGIKVDKGKIPLANASGEEITQGLDGLAQRLEQYKTQGARFAKWRNVYHISDRTPTHQAVIANSEVLARYAAICQSKGVVPIVEPEVLIDGDHTIERCSEVSQFVFHELYHALQRHHVVLEHTILKPNMMVAGKNFAHKESPERVAEETIKILRRTVPAAVPSINFLSGGQTPEEATANLNAINQAGSQPWELSFSYGRALQQPALKAWQGKAENSDKTQAALFQRARLNSLARTGKYTSDMENN